MLIWFSGIGALPYEFVPDVEDHQQQSAIADSIACPQHSDPTDPAHKDLLQRHQQRDYSVDYRLYQSTPSKAGGLSPFVTLRIRKVILASVDINIYLIY